MTGRKFDIIYSGPTHPQSNQGSANLYTSMGSITSDYRMIQKKMRRKEIREDSKRLKSIGFQKSYEFITEFVMSEKNLRMLVSRVNVLSTNLVDRYVLQ